TKTAVDEKGHEVEILERYTKDGVGDGIKHQLGFNLAVPLMFEASPKFTGRGKSIFDGKIGAFDALDEIVSTWVDALRDGRVQKYIPNQYLPRDARSGRVKGLNPFQSRFIQTQMDLSEGADNSVKIVQPSIATSAFEASYASFLTMALQGIVAPATLGIDLRRNDNAAAQREREKATLYTRGKIIGALRGCIKKLVERVLAFDDAINGFEVGSYEATVEFGEYATPTFDAQIEAVARGVAGGVISVETAVEQLYGDTWSAEQKRVEVERLKA
ncbi:MAG: capsid protein, partial [Defluviitaleaceae bacterium]|nr:capsid protein [Defluviitaleaceae bacterium]